MKRRRFFLLLCLFPLFVLGVCASVPAFAQEKPIPGGSRSPAVPSPSDMPDLKLLDLLDPTSREAVLAESRKFHHNCMTNSMQKVFFNCDCLALHYIDIRLEMGPETHESLVLFEIGQSIDIGRKCVDPVSIAGYHWQRCGDLISGYQKPDQDQICACFANEMAKSFTERPVYDTHTMVNMPAEAFGVCGLHGRVIPRTRR